MWTWVKGAWNSLTVVAAVAAAIAAFLAWNTAGDAKDIARQSLHEAQQTGKDTRDTNAVARKAAAAASAAAALSTATFTDPPQLGKPRECKLAPHTGLPVSGTATMRHGQELWLLVRPPQEPTFYITSDAPLPVSASGNWSGDTQTLGAVEDHGATFQLILVASSINASTILQRGYQSDGQVHTLPGGVDIIQTACVQRE